MQDFRNVDAWKRAHELALRIYRITRQFPKEEVFGVTMQLRRSAIAVPQKIAVACGSEPVSMNTELRKAAAITSDLEYVILLAGDLELLRGEEGDVLMEEVVGTRKMIYGLIRSRA